MDKQTILKMILPSEEEKKQTLATTIYKISEENAYYASTLQCLNIDYTLGIETAGVCFNNDLKRWDMHINPIFFTKILSQPEREAVLLHEIFHIVNKHPIRVPMSSLEGEKRQQLNVAADLAINQFIKNLPDGAMLLKNFKYKDDNGEEHIFPENKTMEFYYNLLEQNPENMEKLKKKMEKVKNGEGDPNGKHEWDGSGDEKDMLDATEELFKRAMIKSNFDYSNLPKSVQDLFEFITKRRAELNYKALIMLALKSSLPANVRKNSWTRRSKRYDFLAPGTKNAEQPELDNYTDTSGSISVEEANEFLSILDEFLKVGSRKCTLNLFHTSVYHTQVYKLGQRIEPQIFQSGGTDLTECFKMIAKKNSDLAIIYTDGYYSDVNVESFVGANRKFPRVLFLISKDGNKDHPFKNRDWAITVKIPGSKK